MLVDYFKAMWYFKHDEPFRPVGSNGRHKPLSRMRLP